MTFISQEMANKDVASLVATQLSEADKPQTKKELEPWRKKLTQLKLNIVTTQEAWTREKFRLFCQEELARGTSFLMLDHSALFVG